MERRDTRDRRGEARGRDAATSSPVPAKPRVASYHESSASAQLETGRGITRRVTP